MKKKITFFEKIVLIVSYLLITLAFSDEILSTKLLIVFTFYLNVRIIFYFRDNKLLIVLFIFLLNYIIPFIYHFYWGVSVSMHSAFNTSYYLAIVLNIFCLFLLSLFVSLKPRSKYVYITERITFYSSNKVFYGMLVLTLLVFVFGLSGQNLLEGNYAEIDSSRSPLFEYSLIFILLMIFSAGKSKKKMQIIYFISFLIIAKDFIYGGRVTSIQLILLLYIFIFEKKIPLKTQIVLGVFIFLAIQAVSVIRSNPLILTDQNFSIIELIDFPTLEKETDVLASNQGDITQSSARLVGFVKTGILTTNDRIMSSIYSFSSVLTPGITFSELANIAGYRKKEYTAGGGALFPIYFFVWFSYLGVILSGFLISKIISIFESSTSNKWLLYSSLVIITFPRWIGYNPIVIFKLCFYIIPLYLFLIKFGLFNLNFTHENRN